jgi:4-hydroxy-tetrahydrodipicolinate synthase
MTDFSGAWTALVTPFTADVARVDTDRLRANIRQQADAGMTGVVPCGTTGETPTLSDAEYRHVVETTIACAHEAGIRVMPGAGSNCTAHAVNLHCMAADLGADAALHVTPYYNKPTAPGLERHFLTIADAVDLPVVLYNIPGRTGVVLTIETIERLAGHENIVAIKEATGSLELAGRIRERTDLTILSGDDPLTLPLATMGATGVISVLGNLLPDRVAGLCRAILAGDWETAKAEHQSLVPIARGLLALDTNPVPVKTALQILDRDTGAVRLPLCPPPPDVVESIRTLVASVVPVGATA